MYQRKNFAYGTVLTPPSPADSGTSIVLNSGHGARFPNTSGGTYVCVVKQVSVPCTPENSEVVLVTSHDPAGDTFTITREQESSGARTIIAGDEFYLAPTDGVWDQIDVLTTKGDLLSQSAAGVYARLAVGTNGYALVADSGETAGLKWIDLASRTETLSNKTLTAPKLADGGFIADANGNEVIKATTTASAVNEITVVPGATGSPVQVQATGGDTNIDLKLVPKGTGGILDKNGDYLGPNYSMSRQAIINGNFDIWQRATSVTATTSGIYDLADRWKKWISADGGTLPTTITQSRQIVTPGELPYSHYFYRIAPNGAGSGFGADADHQIETLIENGNRLLCGNGKKVTVSFWARSSIANKKIGLAIWQGYGTGGSPSADEDITGDNWTLTSTWTKYTKTFTTNTHSGKTFGTDENDVLGISIFVMWGTGVFGAVVNSSGVAESYVGSGNIDIAQVQLCAGDVALPFSPKSEEEEKRSCQRYYQKFGDGTNGLAIAMGHGITTGRIDASFVFPVQMRIAPTCTYSAITANDASAAETLSALNAGSIYGKHSASLQFDCSSTATVDRVYKLITSSTSGYIDFSAEL